MANNINRMKGKVKSSTQTYHGKKKDSRAQLGLLRLGKTGRVNSFLAHPAAYSLQEPEKHASVSIDPEHIEQVEPWLKVYEANEPTQRQERAIRSEINAMLGVPEEEVRAGREGKTVDSRLISQKLRKYQPTNGSFSLFYGQKRGFQKMVGEDLLNQGSSRTSMPKFRLPVLPVKRSSQDLRELRESRRSQRGAFMSRNQLSRASAGAGNNQAILSQLRKIDRAGEVLTDYSSRLIKRIDRASLIVDQKYNKLNSITDEMMADVGTYYLEEETDGSYKKANFGTPQRLHRR